MSHAMAAMSMRNKKKQFAQQSIPKQKSAAIET